MTPSLLSRGLHHCIGTWRRSTQRQLILRRRETRSTTKWSLFHQHLSSTEVLKLIQIQTMCNRQTRVLPLGRQMSGLQTQHQILEVLCLDKTSLPLFDLKRRFDSRPFDQRVVTVMVAAWASTHMHSLHCGKVLRRISRP